MSAMDRAFISAFRQDQAGQEVRGPAGSASTPPQPAEAQSPTSQLIAAVRQQQKAAGQAHQPSTHVPSPDPIWHAHVHQSPPGQGASYQQGPHGQPTSAANFQPPPPIHIPHAPHGQDLLAPHANFGDPASGTNQSASGANAGPTGSPKFERHDLGHFDGPRQPLYQVDSFVWPELCQWIIGQMGAHLDRCVKRMLGAARGGQKVIAVTGTGRGEGRTTFLLCLAHRLGAAHIKTAVVDADFANPAVAGRLGVLPQADWADIAAHEQSVWDVLIESLADRLTLLPLKQPTYQAATLCNDLYWPVVLGTLRDHHQIVLVDAGALPDERNAARSCFALGRQTGIDAAIVLRDARTRAQHETAISAAVTPLVQAGIDILGIAENFHRAEAA